MSLKTRIQVNGTDHTLTADPQKSLLDALREDLELTGAKYGCGEGQCGACTVLINGQPTRSCITPLVAVEGKPIVTIEGLEKNGQLHPVQQAFIDADAMQCGYCTPGMILSAVAFLNRNPEPNETEIARGLQGNICRCGTYPRIVEAVGKAAKAKKGGAK